MVTNKSRNIQRQATGQEGSLLSYTIPKRKKIHKQLINDENMSFPKNSSVNFFRKSTKNKEDKY